MEFIFRTSRVQCNFCQFGQFPSQTPSLTASKSSNFCQFGQFRSVYHALIKQAIITASKSSKLCYACSISEEEQRSRGTGERGSRVLTEDGGRWARGRRSRTAAAGARRSRTAAAGAPLICGGGAPLRGWRWWGASSGMAAAGAPLRRRWPGLLCDGAGVSIWIE
jgi:hypothetical protein